MAIAALLVGCGRLAAAPACDASARRVLFVGNSYTFYNNLPGVLAALSEAAPGGAIHVGRVTAGGATLAGLWRQGAAVDSLRTGRFDCVVLQEQSLLGGIRIDGEPVLGPPDSLLAYARRFRDEAALHGAGTLLLLTWARRAAPDQQAGLDHAYFSVGRELGIDVVPAGPVWARLRDGPMETVLHAGDGSHPSPAGTWVTAVVLLGWLGGDEAMAAATSTVRVDSIDSEGSLVTGAVSELRVPDALAETVRVIAGATLRRVRMVGGWPVTRPPAPAPLPEVPAGRPVAADALRGTWAGELRMNVPGSLILAVESNGGDSLAGVAHLRLGTSDYEAPLEGAVVRDGVVLGEVPIGMGGSVRFRAAFRGDSLIGAAELFLHRLIAVSTLRMTRRSGAGHPD